MLAASETRPATTRIIRHDPNASILTAFGKSNIAIRPGTVIEKDGRTHDFPEGASIPLDDLKPGRDYVVTLDTAGSPLVAEARGNPIDGGGIAGFHFAPGGNAEARAGGDAQPAINPFSLWDIDFRPACADPRGMALVEADGVKTWVDIYLLGTEHKAQGTSRHGAKIADGWSLERLDFKTASEIMASHSKRLLTYDEFRIAASGVTERSAHSGDPDVTVLDAPRTSRFGLMQATGNLWIWGTDGDGEDPRPSIFGGSWFDGSSAGSRYAYLACWPENSNESLSARGACDHLKPA